MEEEEEVLRIQCRKLISRVRSKQASEEERGRHKHKGARGSERTEPERLVAGFTDHRRCNLSLPDCAQLERDQTSRNLVCQGPGGQPVPLKLISMLRLKTFREEMRRAAEAELHDPSVCSACEQEQASLALRSFIRRKKTQLHFQTLKGRLNTHSSYGECACWGSLCQISQRPPLPLTGFGRNYLVDTCRSQQPGVALATTKEGGVSLATDEMRGYPDKNATGTHLVSPHCPFPDR
ncbi:uncharacterized protein LOC123957944 [Micropterus dolomieu]|uniref:uncharacterized protein LOC123957944 n=1 Tax=Micropterus dolomieu TaxID=147949 RepID=UPI001E8E3B2A|nr:uncharacterized protein LOC123957944 [Micropterus dolomieu]